MRRMKDSILYSNFFYPFWKNGLFDLCLIKNCFKWELVFGSKPSWGEAGPINPVSGKIQPMKKEIFDGKYDIVRDGIMTKWECVWVCEREIEEDENGRKFKRERERKSGEMCVNVREREREWECVCEREGVKEGPGSIERASDGANKYSAYSWSQRAYFSRSDQWGRWNIEKFIKV